MMILMLKVETKILPTVIYWILWILIVFVDSRAFFLVIDFNCTSTLYSTVIFYFIFNNVQGEIVARSTKTRTRKCFKHAKATWTCPESIVWTSCSVRWIYQFLVCSLDHIFNQKCEQFLNKVLIYFMSHSTEVVLKPWKAISP